MLPCSRNEAMARLIEMLPQRAVEAALRSKSGSKWHTASRALRHLIGVRLIEDGDRLFEKRCGGGLRGERVLKILKEQLSIAESETQFSQSTLCAYRLSLKTLGWIEVSENVWKWKGPDDAEWSAVTRENQRKK